MAFRLDTDGVVGEKGKPRPLFVKESAGSLDKVVLTCSRIQEFANETRILNAPN